MGGKSAKMKSKVSKPLKVAKTVKKAAPAPKKPNLKKALASKAEPKLSKKETQALSKTKALEVAKKSLQAPTDAFLSKWKPKNESFEAGLDRFLGDLGFAEKERAPLLPDLIEKLYTSMRKEGLSPAIEEQLQERFPKDRVHKLGSIFTMKPKTSIRLNYLKADIAGFSNSLVAQELKMKRSRISPWAFEVGKPEGLKNHPLIDRGVFEIEDEGHQLVSLLSNARPGQRVLDLCANFGNNSLNMSMMMRNKGSLFVYEAEPKRIKMFRERAAKAGIDNFRVLTDGQLGEVKSLDIVMVEAPSSHIGEVSGRPELKWRFHKEELTRLHKLQAALLREGARKLKLGGHLVYATTSLSKSENEGQIEHFLRTSHNSYRLVPIQQYMKDYVMPYVQNYFNFQWDEKLLQSMLETDPFLLLSPDVHGCQGLFVSVIQRTRIST